MAHIPQRKSAPIHVHIFAECDDFEQFAHFMLRGQNVQSVGSLNVIRRIRLRKLRREQIQNPQIKQEIRLRGVANQIQSR